MPQVVIGPDGARHEFPDGTPPEVMKAAMARQYGPPVAAAQAPASGAPAAQAPALSPFERLQSRGVAGQLGASTLSATDALVEGFLSLPKFAGDVGAGVLNAPGAAVEFLQSRDLIPTPENQPDLTPFVGGSRSIGALKEQADAALQRAGVPDVDVAALDPFEKVLYRTVEYGAPAVATLGASAAPGAAKAAAKVSPAVGGLVDDAARQLRTRPARAVTNEIAAALGSATGLTAAEEAGAGPIGQLAASLAGGAGAGTLQSAGFSALDAVRGAGRERQAARVLRDLATNPAQAADNVATTAAAADRLGAQAPDALLASGDPGLIAFDRHIRNQPSVSSRIVQNDQRVGAGVSRAVNDLRDPKADPDAVRVAAQKSRAKLDLENETALAAAEKALDDAKAFDAAPAAAEAKLAEQAALDPLGANASREIDDVVSGELNRRTTARNAVREDLKKSKEPVDTKYMRQPLADLVRDARKAIDPANRVPPAALNKFAGFVSRRRVPIGELEELRVELADMHQAARQAGQFGKADNIRVLQKLINDAPDNALMRVDPSAIPSAEGRITGPGRADAVRKFESEYFLPFFGKETAGGKFRKAVQRDNGRVDTPPAQTAGRFFLRPGVGAKGAADDLRRIIEIAEDPARGQAAARNYLLASASASVRNDKINPQTLRKWLDQNSEALSAFPDVEKEIRDVLADTINKRAQGAARVGAAADEMKRIAKEAALSEQEFQRSAAQVFLDAEPDKAVTRIFSAPDRAKAMREAMALVSESKDAKEGFKAAVTDWLVKRASSDKVHLTGNNGQPVALNALRKLTKEHRNTLSQVFTTSEMKTLDDAQVVLQAMANQSVKAGVGSDTYANFNFDTGLLPLVLRAKYGHLKGGGIMKTVNLAISKGLGFAKLTPADKKERFFETMLEIASDPKKAEMLLRYEDTDLWADKFVNLLKRPSTPIAAQDAFDPLDDENAE